MNREDQIGLAVVGAGAAFGILGAYSSFEAVRTAMEPSFGQDAWIVPIGVDLGIATASAGDLWMASRDERTWWLRWIPHALAVGTIYFNVVSDNRLEGRVAHALLVILWIAFTAAVAHVVKLRAVGRRPKTERMDRIRGSRWALAPISTAGLWRWMVTNEETDYRTALRYRDERRLVRAELRDASGGGLRGLLLWRLRQSWRDRELYRQGRRPAVAPRGPVVVPEPGSSNGTAALTGVELIAQQMHNAGEKVTRRSLLARAKDQGLPLGTNKAAEIAGRYQ